eukprot:129636_1
MSTLSKIDDLLVKVDNIKIPPKVDEMKSGYDDQQEYTLYYWPVKNRGNFIRLLFATQNIPYQEVNEIKEIEEFFYSKDKKNNSEYIPMHPPALKIENINKDIDNNKYSSFLFCQTVPIILYLSSKFGLLPNNKFDKLRAQEWTENLNDLIVEIYYHNYSEFKGANCRRTKITKDEINQWINDRFYRFVNPLEKHLTNGNLEYFFDNKMSYFDLVIFNVMDGLKELFGPKYDDIVAKKCKHLNIHYLKISRHEYVKRLLEQQKDNNVAWFWLPDQSWQRTKLMMEWI